MYGYCHLPPVTLQLLKEMLTNHIDQRNNKARMPNTFSCGPINLFLGNFPSNCSLKFVFIVLDSFYCNPFIVNLHTETLLKKSSSMAYYIIGPGMLRYEAKIKRLLYQCNTYFMGKIESVIYFTFVVACCYLIF